MCSAEVVMIRRMGLVLAMASLMVSCSVTPTPIGATASAGRSPSSTPTAIAGVTLISTAEVVCDGIPTFAQTEGPYYKAGSPERSSLVEADTVGEVLILTGRVLSTDCDPIVGALVDIWQADGGGVYDNDGYRLRGRVRTDGDGVYEIETVVPGEYPGRTPHIHVKVFEPDGSERLTTQIYLAGISDQVADSIFSNDLLAIDLPPGADGTKRIQFDIVLSA
jgi:protocatechuate 3,4-dioxygenase beta subunit